MKDQFTTLLSDAVQHQVELQGGIEELLRLVKQPDNARSAHALREQMDELNTRVTALANRLGAQWVP